MHFFILAILSLLSCGCAEAETLIQKPSIFIIGIQCKTSPQTAATDIPKHWEKFLSENITQQIPNKASNDVIALYCDYEGDYTQPYSLVIGCPVESLQNLPEGMVIKEIPAGSYRVFEAIGEHPKSTIEMWNHIWQQDLKRTYTGDYELYGEKFYQSPSEVEIYIAVEPN